jgi:hypothetical protein
MSAIKEVIRYRKTGSHSVILSHLLFHEFRQEKKVPFPVPLSFHLVQSKVLLPVLWLLVCFCYVRENAILLQPGLNAEVSPTHKA